MHILVTGAGGMLAADVVRAARRAGHGVTALAHDELDIGDSAALALVLASSARESLLPGSRRAAAPLDAVVNCAAWTDVDGAESAQAAAFAVNAYAAQTLAQACAGAGVKLAHVSSDYVFDGNARLDADEKPRPFTESDEPAPASVYGRSKLAGERYVSAASERNLVVRSSWLFGLSGPSFVQTMLRLGEERARVQVVDDQVGCPTWTGHLAPALIGLLEREVSGLVHQAGSGAVSWNGFAREIFRQAGVDCAVESATTAQMGRAAPRPAYSALASERSDVLPMPPWQDGLAGFLAQRAGMVRA